MRQHRNSQERKYKPSAPDSKPTRGQSMNAEPEYIYLPKKINSGKNIIGPQGKDITTQEGHHKSKRDKT